VATDTTSDKDEEDMVNARQQESEHGQTDSDIEAKLANVKDQKEAKRLKRYSLPLPLHPCTLDYVLRPT